MATAEFVLVPPGIGAYHSILKQAFKQYSKCATYSSGKIAEMSAQLIQWQKRNERLTNGSSEELPPEEELQNKRQKYKSYKEIAADIRKALEEHKKAISFCKPFPLEPLLEPLRKMGMYKISVKIQKMYGKIFQKNLPRLIEEQEKLSRLLQESTEIMDGLRECLETLERIYKKEETWLNKLFNLLSLSQR